MKSMHLDTLFRPAYEARAALGWLGAVCWVVGLGLLTRMAMPALATMLAMALVMLLLRGWQTSRVWQVKLRLAGHLFGFIRPAHLNAVRAQLQDRVWLGWGWEWQPSHTQLAYDISKVDKREIYPPRWWLKHFGGGIDPFTSKGKAWIHGMEEEENIIVPKATFVGHTGIIATTGALKTTLYKLMVYQFAMQGDCVIIIDPKGDKDLFAAGRDAAAAIGEPDRFISFRPAFPSNSIRLDGLKNWDRETQVASRVKQIISAGEDDNFINFCWTVTTNLVGSMKLVGRRPTFAALLDHVQTLENPERLCEEVLYAYLSPRLPDLTQHLTDKSRLADVPQGRGKAGRGGLAERASPRLTVLIQLFRELPIEDQPRAISGLIAMLEANREWFSKMVTAMVPTLTKIASLGPLMSPDYDDLTDERPIYDIKKIVDGRKIFYCGIDALSDPTVAGAIAALIIADAAGYAGETYNYGEGKPPRVHLIIDEARDATSETLLQILNKGRGAGLMVYLAMQAIADLVVALGNNEALAERILANLNNFIIGATQDPRTREFLESMLGEVPVMMKGVAQGSGQKTEDIGLEYSANRMVMRKEIQLPMISGDLLSALPDLHYISVLNRSEVRKGRVPILEFA